HLPMCSFTASLLPLSYLLFSVIRAPPAPTLVPYTTLFRSVLGHSGQPGGVVEADGRLVERDPADHGRAGRENGVGPAVHRRELADRKSTRLNSSHVSNSYAVFCLKKKNAPLQHCYLIHWIK